MQQEISTLADDIRQLATGIEERALQSGIPLNGPRIERMAFQLRNARSCLLVAMDAINEALNVADRQEAISRAIAPPLPLWDVEPSS